MDKKLVKIYSVKHILVAAVVLRQYARGLAIHGSQKVEGLIVGRGNCKI